jgi:signal peptidase I
MKNLSEKSWVKLKKKVKFFLIFLFIVILIRIFFLQVYVVSGNSMVPTLRNGDIVFVWKFLFPVKTEFFPWEFIYAKPNLSRMDIIIFEDQNNEISLKRVLGVPYEYYEINYGKVMIESTVLEEDYLPEGSETEKPSNKIVYQFPNSPFLQMQNKGRIPPNYYMLLGDNREYSTDSRSMGFVPLDKIRGKVFFTIP